MAGALPRAPRCACTDAHNETRGPLGRARLRWRCGRWHNALMLERIFFSTSVYALAHQIGMAQAILEVERQIEAPDRNSLPVVRTLHRFRQLGEVGRLIDGGATYIGMARSRAFHDAYEQMKLDPKMGAWVTV